VLAVALTNPVVTTEIVAATVSTAGGMMTNSNTPFEPSGTWYGGLANAIGATVGRFLGN
jgi:hypothetical protein